MIQLAAQDNDTFWWLMGVIGSVIAVIVGSGFMKIVAVLGDIKDQLANVRESIAVIKIELAPIKPLQDRVHSLEIWKAQKNGLVRTMTEHDIEDGA